MTQKSKEPLTQEDSLLSSDLSHRALLDDKEKDKTMKKCTYFQEARATVWRKTGERREFHKDRLTSRRELKSNSKAKVKGNRQALKAPQLQSKDFQSTE